MRISFSTAGLAEVVALLACSSPESDSSADTTVANTSDTSMGDLADPDAPLDTGPGACEVASDCPGLLDLCVSATCTPQTPCVSDKQCSDHGFVCDTTAGVCVVCLADTDCGGSGQTCRAQTCVDPSGTCASSKECPTGQICDKAAGVCVGCLQDSECDPLQHCEETVCKPDLCHADEVACVDGQTRKICSANGSSWSNEACGEDTTCLNGACQKLLCPPGAKSCVDGQNRVQICNATGTAWGEADACVGKTSCKDGACQPQVCTPGEKKCNAQGGLDQCTPDGLEVTAWYCPATGDGKPQTCGVKDGVAACMSQACAPNSLFCDGAKAMMCDAKGLTATQTADCSLNAPGGAAQLCLDGACAPAACKAGDKACADPTTLATCKATGDGYDKTACKQGEACETGACKPVVCAAGQLSCDGGKATQCSAGGTAIQVIDDCGAKGKVCLQGTCVAKVCTGGELKCQGGQFGTCKADGTGWTLAPCPQGETCSGGKCTSKLCEAGTQGCNGAVVAACNGSGTAWVTIEDCPGKGLTCADGACAKAQSGFLVRGGFQSMTDTGAGAYRILDQGWQSGGVCLLEYCVRGGFAP